MKNPTLIFRAIIYKVSDGRSTKKWCAKFFKPSRILMYHYMFWIDFTGYKPDLQLKGNSVKKYSLIFRELKLPQK